MKKVFFGIIALTTSVFFACQQTDSHAGHEGHEHAADEASAEVSYPKDSLSADGATSWHGNRISGNDALDATKLLAMMQGKTVMENLTFSAPVEECCQTKGCWMQVKTSPGDAMRVTFKDYGFFVPKDASGSVAVMHGKAVLDTVSVEMLRHYAEDGGKPAAEIAKINKPEIKVAFEADGVVLRKDLKKKS